MIGATPHERTPERLAQRNGHRARVLSDRWDLELRVPTLRAGSFFPSLLERRRRVDQALFGGDGGLPARSEHPQVAEAITSAELDQSDRVF